MQGKFLVGGIWDGACRSSCAHDSTLLKALVRELVPVRISVFEMHGWPVIPSVMLDDIEPIPGFCLGDILAEELDVDVPFGSLVVIRDQNPLANLSEAVGNIIGEILLSIIGRGMFPLADEDSVLYALGLTYFRAAETEILVRMGLEATAFRFGLNAVLSRYWAQPCEQSCLFSLDANPQNQSVQHRDFILRDMAIPSLSALTDFDGRPTMNQWTLKLKTLVGDCSERFAIAAFHGNARTA